jgi:hypothetical protein
MPENTQNNRNAYNAACVNYPGTLLFLGMTFIPKNIHNIVFLCSSAHDKR